MRSVVASALVVFTIAYVVCKFRREIRLFDKSMTDEHMIHQLAIFLCKREGKKMGRPESYKKDIEAYKLQYQRELGLLKKGVSLRNISAITGAAVNTIRKVKDMFIDSEL